MDKKYFIKWTAPAREDIKEIIDYISKTNINYAVKILDSGLVRQLRTFGSS
jgi:plasmid stabilization system protein ParE